jgi:2-dehydro-3-deoxy-D-arabinonate dehydratase
VHIVRYAADEATIRAGLLEDDVIRPFPAKLRIADLLQLSLEDLRSLVDEVRVDAAGLAPAGVRLLPPADGRMEVWAAGVTYQRSREARMEESTERSVYDRVYDAPRPELFFKALPWRVVTDGEPIAVRADSPLNVPEPELGLVVNSGGEVVGYLVVNDVSSRSIEGDNPLYLPQAKVYTGSCAIASGIVPAWTVLEPDALEITMTVRRGDLIAFEGSTSTSSFHRVPGELVEHLLRGQPFPDGVLLATGTGVVPGMDFTLRSGDVVRISIAGVGNLTNPVLDTEEWLREHEESVW